MQLALLLASADDGGGNILISLIPFIIIGVVMYMLLIRPQRRKMREQQDLQAAVGVGDEVITTSGVYGFVTGEDEENGLFWLEIDDDVQIRIARAAIQRRIVTGTDEAEDQADDETAEPADEVDADTDPDES